MNDKRFNLAIILWKLYGKAERTLMGQGKNQVEPRMAWRTCASRRMAKEKPWFPNGGRTTPSQRAPGPGQKRPWGKGSRKKKTLGNPGKKVVQKGSPKRKTGGQKKAPKKKKGLLRTD